VGINLNPNRACNWRCIYCQVPGLVRGTAPPVDLEGLEQELRDFLTDVVHGDFLVRAVPPGARVLRDIALSGDGEPTTCRNFDRVVERVGRVMADLDLVGRAKLVLITNGSLVHRREVLHGLEQMGRLGGEVWFKLDAGTEEDRLRINSARMSDRAVLRNLALAAERCPVRIQICAFDLDGDPPSEAWSRSQLDLLRKALETPIPLLGVSLYNIERPSHQPEAPRLSKAPRDWMEAFAQRIRLLGLEVDVHA
jgi:wyosine [tRNA(Phe)-imidazoG37] synthetase (radical SAM superfamily)